MSSLQRIEMDHHVLCERRIGRNGDDDFDPLGPNAQPAGYWVAREACEAEPAASIGAPWPTPRSTWSDSIVARAPMDAAGLDDERDENARRDDLGAVPTDGRP